MKTSSLIIAALALTACVSARADISQFNNSLDAGIDNDTCVVDNGQLKLSFQLSGFKYGSCRKEKLLERREYLQLSQNSENVIEASGSTQVESFYLNTKGSVLIQGMNNDGISYSFYINTNGKDKLIVLPTIHHTLTKSGPSYGQYKISITNINVTEKSNKSIFISSINVK